MHLFYLIVINFIEAFKKIAKRKRYIFLFTNNFSRFSILIVFKIANVLNVIRCIRKTFQKYRKLIEIYYDHDHHFNHEKLRNFKKKKDIKIIYNFSKTLKTSI